ncbi:hypothetical protein Kpol_1004p18 [Vanderwaltozyma polyspora DSM 70294]|uniref:Vps53 N-terminal domain-containing protein n=1 Tax=Vanderwaltozyma polyspora (strain ATCC 22028 / DSM 70294 / BCRC 21397 / CBS 2163 / NBRC 10782 / NRRL Y-8283 / UCD 57-17) TaxID=436907 RepID=A7TJ75_VANPO|nr:uncharacterized protein Kpol_1004p18 [Vanderwaltozyma polyspora DSM 70294]EDO17644.1 hypothetical protein Kpol_1004p18 [Vanderwaltozyma polyspora DSM 70294]
MISKSLEYDPLEDITTILAHKESLDDIDNLIAATKNHRINLENEVLELDEERKKSVDGLSGKDGIDDFDFLNVFKDFEDTKKFASVTQNNISRLTEGISHLDYAKKNLTQSMTLFQNLQILTDSYTECKKLLGKKSFIELSSSYKIMCSMSENTFASYKSVDEINKLLASIARLKANVLDEIMNSYKKILSGRIPENSLMKKELKVGVSELLESDHGSKAQVIDFCINKLLYEITEIFQIDDEAGSLENLPRRYIFFKKILNNYNSNFSPFFADTWEIPQKLTSKFYSMTRKDLQLLLKRELSGTSPSVDLFMNSLQETLEFEKYIDVRFSRKITDEKLSKTFEPYLSLWITHQEKSMKDKILAYMSESKLPENPSDSLVIPSSADLFRTYRSVLSQTMELTGSGTNDNILKSLASFFSKWLHEYYEKILKPLLLPPNVEIKNKDEAIQYTVLLVNTADYCSVTINQLEEKLVEFSKDSERISKIFIPIKDLYGDILARGNNFLLSRIVALDMTYVWREFNNIDWSRIEVEDYSRYMITLANVLSFASDSATLTSSSVKKSSVESIVTQFNRDVYSWNFLDKIIDLVSYDFVGCIIKLLQPVPPFASTTSTRKLSAEKIVVIGDQLLLDVSKMKDTMNLMLDMMSKSSIQSTSLNRVKKHSDNNINLLTRFIKLLMAPINSPDDYHENYKTLTGNNINTAVWSFLFALKGASWDLNFWQQHWTVFNLDLEKDDSSEPVQTNDNFIFIWQPELFAQFQVNLLRIQNLSWTDFIRNELKITMPKRTVASSNIKS